MTLSNRHLTALIVLSAAAMLVILVTLSMFATDSSGEGVRIELVDKDGSELGDQPFMSSDVYFDTMTTADGTSYLLTEGTELKTVEAYIRTVTDEGTFAIKLSASTDLGGSLGYLVDTGLKFAVEDGGKTYYAILDGQSGYAALALDENGEPHIFHPNQSYRVKLYTAHGYESYIEPKAAKGITFTFDAIFDQLYPVEFVSEGETVEIRNLSSDSQLGKLPTPARDGYVLAGWLDSEGYAVTMHTKVSDLPSDRVVYAEWEINDGQWPKIVHTEKIVDDGAGNRTVIDTTITTNEDGTVHTVVDEKITKPNGSTDETKYDEITDKDGNTTGTHSRTINENHDDGSKTWTEEWEKVNEDGSQETYHTVINYDKDNNVTDSEIDTTQTDPEGNKRTYHEDEHATRHSDESETWENHKKTTEPDGSSREITTVTDYEPDGTMFHEVMDIVIKDPQGNETDYRVIYSLKDNGDAIVSGMLPEMTVQHVIGVTEFVEQYQYELAAVTTLDETGNIIVKHDVIMAAVDEGYGISVYRGDEHVIIDKDVVKHLSVTEGELTLTLRDSLPEDMTDAQRASVGSNYAVTVLLTMNGEYVTQLEGTADVALSPGYQAVNVYRVEDNGSLTKIESSYDPETGITQFTVDHFSIYMVEGPHDEPSGFPMWILWVAIAISIVLLILLIIIIIKKRRSEDEEEQQQQ